MWAVVSAPGHWAALRPLPQGGHRVPREGPPLQRKAPKCQHGWHQGMCARSLNIPPFLEHFELNLWTSCSQHGKLSKELDFVHHSLRTKLDELKREEMNRLRMLIKAKHDLQGGNGKYPACLWQTALCTRSLEIGSWVIFKQEVAVRHRNMIQHHKLSHIGHVVDSFQAHVKKLCELCPDKLLKLFESNWQLNQ